jgi:uncharacterized protein (TIGR02145 family)
MRKILGLSIILSLLMSTGLNAQARKGDLIRDSIVDPRDSHVYKMVKIGKKFWTIENLKWECEGSFIYENMPRNLKKHGRLYTYDASRNACPVGSHLPSKQEWDSLEHFVDPKDNGDAGSKLMKKSNPGFAATYGGYRDSKNKFEQIESVGCYWGSDNAVSFQGGFDGINFYVNDKIEKKDLKNAYSIRCVKD